MRATGPPRTLPDLTMSSVLSCPHRPPESRNCLLRERLHAHVDHHVVAASCFLCLEIRLSIDFLIDFPIVKSL